MLTPTANFAVDPDQTVPRRAVRFGSKLFATKTSYGQTKHCESSSGCSSDSSRYVRKMQLMLTSMANFSIQTNIVDLDQTALRRAE